MRVKFFIFDKVNFIGIKTSRQLTCLYIRPLIFSVYVWPKISKKNLLCILQLNSNSFNIRNWVAVGVVHAGLSAASDCAMVRKVRVTNGMQELRTEEDSLELRQVGSW